jgi:hypothetical protein
VEVGFGQQRLDLGVNAPIAVEHEHLDAGERRSRGPR